MPGIADLLVWRSIGSRECAGESRAESGQIVWLFRPGCVAWLGYGPPDSRSNAGYEREALFDVAECFESTSNFGVWRDLEDLIRMTCERLVEQG